MTLIVFISFIVLPFLFLYKSEFKNENKEFLSMSQTNQIKGLFAIFVMLVHFSQRMINPAAMTVFKNPGYIAVGGFFFLSGYGLYSSYMKKREINFKKSLSRIIQIYKPFILITLIYIIINIFYNGQKYSISDIVLSILNIKQIDPITWYLLTMLYFYIAFYLSYRYFKNKNCEIALFIMSFIYLIAAIILKNNEIWWYNTTFMFFIGVIFKKYEKIIREKIIKKEIMLCLTVLILFGMHLAIFRENVISQSLITALVIFAFMILNLRIKYNSKFFMFMGIISYEIYLIHMKLFNIIFRDKIFERVGNIDFILFFTGTIITSALIYGVVNIKKIIKERRNNSE